jgi:hypothetical protein
MDTEQQLISETKKWKARIEDEMTRVAARGERGKEFTENIRAYISDSSYFLEKEDFVRAFEAIIWAWAILETGKKAELLD